MKKILLAAAASAVMLFAVSCERFDIPGTRWAGYTAGTMNAGGVELQIGTNDTLTFTGEAAGRLIRKEYASMAGVYQDGETTSIEFTYKFDGTNGTITFNKKAHPFTYNKKNKELTLQIITPDEPGYTEYMQTFVHNEIYFKMY